MPAVSATDNQLTTRHSFRLPAKALQLVEIHSEHQLEHVELGSPCLILGEGTNTLFVEDFQGQVLVNKLAGVHIVEYKHHWSVSAAGGENWHQLVLTLHARGIHGFENLALIPGTVGAAPVQNIGAYGVEVADFIKSVEFYSLCERSFQCWTAAECEFGYRSSRFKTEAEALRFITLVHFEIPKAWQPVLSYGELQQLATPAKAATLLKAIIQIRSAKLPDPTQLPNAGSFFKNPTVSNAQAEALKAKFPAMPIFPIGDKHAKLAAGWLIEHAGLKALHVGAAAVHKQQALVLVNHGGATGEQVLKLAADIQRCVLERYGVELEPEARLIGRNGLLSSLVQEGLTP
ncbi:UDP-N-acetylmuramate dehydrogenase [Aliidiomarina celeris]|uniref:UDP-N-acetylmuramate dehydrogenase n=1 Tax=Aliidiomarina celeris TaxID=2249428 RepID=UPI000DE913A4|nr:UDP-N-acetylmuramate dehydrogenase [Aliidiomarina celeris]